MKRNYRSLIATALAMCIVGGAAPTFGCFAPDTAITASAEENSGTCGDNLTWTLDDGTLTISGTGDMYDYNEMSAPSPFYTLSYSNGYDIKYVLIDDGVTSIGEEAFEYCSSLQSITIASSVTSIGYCAFEQCTSLTSITIPNSVESIGRYAFSYCPSLESITVSPTNSNYSSKSGVLFDKQGTTLLFYPEGKKDSYYFVPEGTVKIANYAVKDQPYLEFVYIADSVEEIGEGNFSFFSATMNNDTGIYESGSNLKYIYLGKNLKTIGDIFLNNTMKLEEISVSPDNEYFTSADGVLFTKDMQTLMKYPPNSERTIYAVPDGVEIIGRDSFDYNMNLKSITIPDSVTYINIAFMRSANLQSVDIGSGINTLYDSFRYCSKLRSLTIRSNGYYSISDHAINNDEHFNGETWKTEYPYSGVLRGYSGTALEEYAKKYDYTFIPLDDESNIIYGDANDNDTVELADAVLILQSIANPDKYGIYGTEDNHINAFGEIKADCSGDGDGLTAMDALAIQKYVLKLVDSLPME